jgi:hypothetical protein
LLQLKCLRNRTEILIAELVSIGYFPDVNLLVFVFGNICMVRCRGFKVENCHVSVIEERTTSYWSIARAQTLWKQLAAYFLGSRWSMCFLLLSLGAGGCHKDVDEGKASEKVEFQGWSRRLQLRRS